VVRSAHRGLQRFVQARGCPESRPRKTSPSAISRIPITGAGVGVLSSLIGATAWSIPSCSFPHQPCPSAVGRGFDAAPGRSSPHPKTDAESGWDVSRWRTLRLLHGLDPPCLDRSQV